MGWSLFLMRLVPAIIWMRRCQRLPRLGIPWILSISPMAVLIFLHCISRCLSFARDLCGSTVIVTFRNRDLQECFLRTLVFYCPTPVYRPSFVLCARLLHGNRVVQPLCSLLLTAILQKCCLRALQPLCTHRGVQALCLCLAYKGHFY